MSNNDGLILYFGAAYLPEFYESAVIHGRRLGLLLNTEGAHDLKPETFEFIHEMKFSDGVDAICQTVKELERKHSIATIINVDEATVKLWAQVCKRLGYRGMNVGSAAVLRNKYLMKQSFVKNLGEEFVTRCARIEHEDDVVDFYGKASGNIVIKPSSLWGSFFVVKCSSLSEAVSNYNRVKDEIFDFCESQKHEDVYPEILAEEYIEGTNHSVECLVLNGEVWSTPVMDVMTGVDIGEDNFHHFARTTMSCLSNEQKLSLQRIARRAVTALEVDVGATHVEFIFGPDGPKIVEIGGRPGVNRTALLAKAHGIDLLQGYIDVLEGRKPNLNPTIDGAAAVVTPYPKTSGVLKSFNRLEELKMLSSVDLVSVQGAVGDHVQTRQEGGWPLVRIDIKSENRHTFKEDFNRLTEISQELYYVES
ncbi:ATP-grasp domain-containing protein [Chromohalobacter sp. 296-RDG]|uniref:ATP-grasp domain-containing protein n=1 Tax=Chromohalobacter sp. 296-RDG TaxID=2994062 RepID=UPI0024694E06|nr:ATP-grasp domain-containing protein [Chromohalobacter sp. 296-RDG]